MFARMLSILVLGLCTYQAQGQSVVRPPAIPLVACDPYFSIWSASNKLTESDTTHWTGKPQRLHSAVTIDGKTWRVIGVEPAGTPALPQTSVTVLPTRTIYQFSSPAVTLTLSFMTPSLPDRIDLLSWPVTYVTFAVRSADGKPHRVSVDFEASPDLAVNDPGQPVVWSRPVIEGLSSVSAGSKIQAVLGRSGDDLRIDWGYLYLGTPQAHRPTWHEHRLTMDLGQVGTTETSRWLMLAYDDLYAIQYMGHNLRPYWRRKGWEAADLLNAAASSYGDLSRRCAGFDNELMADLKSAGGEAYDFPPPSATVNVSRQASSWPTSTGSLFSFAKRITPVASSPLRMCSIRWLRNSCCSARRSPSPSSFPSWPMPRAIAGASPSLRMTLVNTLWPTAQSTVVAKKRWITRCRLKSLATCSCS